MTIEETQLLGDGLGIFRRAEETRVRHRLPDVQLRFDARLAQRSMQDDGVREQQIARPGLQIGRTETLGEIAEDGRQVRIAQIRAAA